MVFLRPCWSTSKSRPSAPLRVAHCRPPCGPLPVRGSLLFGDGCIKMAQLKGLCTLAPVRERLYTIWDYTDPVYDRLGSPFGCADPPAYLTPDEAVYLSGDTVPRDLATNNCAFSAPFLPTKDNLERVTPFQVDPQERPTYKRRPVETVAATERVKRIFHYLVKNSEGRSVLDIAAGAHVGSTDVRITLETHPELFTPRPSKGKRGRACVLWCIANGATPPTS